MRMPKQEEREEDASNILQVGAYTVLLKFQANTEETIEERIAVLARRLSQIVLEEEEEEKS